MKVWNPSFYDLSDSDSLVNGTAHAFQRNRVVSFLLHVSHRTVEQLRETSVLRKTMRCRDVLGARLSVGSYR